MCWGDTYIAQSPYNAPPPPQLLCFPLKPTGSEFPDWVFPLGDKGSQVRVTGISGGTVVRGYCIITGRNFLGAVKPDSRSQTGTKNSALST